MRNSKKDHVRSITKIRSSAGHQDSVHALVYVYRRGVAHTQMYMLKVTRTSGNILMMQRIFQIQQRSLWHNLINLQKGTLRVMRTATVTMWKHAVLRGVKWNKCINCENNIFLNPCEYFRQTHCTWDASTWTSFHRNLVGKVLTYL